MQFVSSVIPPPSSYLFFFFFLICTLSGTPRFRMLWQARPQSPTTNSQALRYLFVVALVETGGCQRVLLSRSTGLESLCGGRAQHTQMTGVHRRRGLRRVLIKRSRAAPSQNERATQTCKNVVATKSAAEMRELKMHE